MKTSMVRERLVMEGVRTLSDAELLTLLGGDMVAGQAVRELAWRSVGELRQLGVGEARAAALAAAFELGRRGAWAPPQRGDRCDGPERVAELMRGLAHAPVEQFHVVLLDVRARLIKTECIAQGSLAQCPVMVRDVFRTAVRENAHGIVFCHNHPSGGGMPVPSPEDEELTMRLRIGAEIIGVVARDHVIVGPGGGYYSFVEAGRWRQLHGRRLP